MPISLGIERLRPQLEDIVAARPAVVVRSYGGDARLDGQLNAMGIRVVRLGFPMAFADARRDLRRVGDELAARARAEALVPAFARALAAARTTADKGRGRGPARWAEGRVGKEGG